jgi:hypothetical protein
VDHAPCTRIPERTRQHRIDAADGGRRTLRTLFAAELEDVLRPDVTDGDALEGCVDVLAPELVGFEAVDAGCRVIPFVRQPDVDRFADRLLGDSGQLPQGPLGLYAAATNRRPGDLPAVLLAQEPLAVAGVPGVTGMAAFLCDGGHGGESYQTRTNGGETEVEMPDDQRDPNTPKERAVQGDSRDLQDVHDASGGETRGDGWYVAEWDDVMWGPVETRPIEHHGEVEPWPWRVAP